LWSRVLASKFIKHVAHVLAAVGVEYTNVFIEVFIKVACV